MVFDRVKTTMQRKYKITDGVMEKESVGYLGGTAEVIVINLFDRLKVNEPFQLGLVLVWAERKEKRNILRYITLCLALMQDLCQPWQETVQSSGRRGETFDVCFRSKNNRQCVLFKQMCLIFLGPWLTPVEKYSRWTCGPITFKIFYSGIGANKESWEMSEQDAHFCLEIN